jgi:hypothetical protein
MNAPQHFPLTLIAASALALFACSGATFIEVAPDGGSPDGGGGDDGATGDGRRDPLCPATAPDNGASCAPDQLACEYGDDPSPACDTIARCGQQTSGRWFVTSPGTVGCGTTNPPVCPSSYAAVPQGQSCATQVGCYYPEARCECAFHCGGLCPAPEDGGSPPLTWGCDLPPANSGCPVPRPRAGDVCAQPGLSCDYGSCTGGVGLQCSNGYWEIVGVACPAEAMSH